MRGFFSQFGEVSRLRLSRNKKTGRSRHFAFIEFADRSVAAVVAETMHNYLLCNKLLVCKVVDADKLHEKTWVGANKKFQRVPWRSIARKRHNQERTATQQRRRQEKLVKKEQRKRQQLSKLGIEYEFAGCKLATGARMLRACSLSDSLFICNCRCGCVEFHQVTLTGQYFTGRGFCAQRNQDDVCGPIRQHIYPAAVAFRVSGVGAYR